jgi:hypothetical protein
MEKGKIYILKNFTLPSESWPALKNIYIPPQLITWGIVIDYVLYFVVIDENKMELECRNFHENLYEENLDKIFIKTNLNVIFSGSENIFSELKLTLDKNKLESNDVIQVKLVEALIGIDLCENLAQQIRSGTLWTVSNQKIINKNIENSTKCILI